ncbi:SCA7, zinc-binding domain-containing protein [Dichotomocladium elegans]|nr:SCA7, zinc-binding domain-containing protein [Dichotomocladium elegans]
MIDMESLDEDSLSEGSFSPSVSRLDTNDRKASGTITVEEDTVTVKCKNCDRNILASSIKAHSETCGKGGGTGHKKPRALAHLSATDKSKLGKPIVSDEEDDDDDDEPLANKRQNELQQQKKKQPRTEESAKDGLDLTSTPEKRPPSSSEKPEKKKTKKEKQKQKGPKPKPPLDLDKQCGVIQGPNNTPCTRSLTCKSHSMGAKRAVAGRSQPYDVLLSAYQKKAIGRPQTSGAPATDKKGGAAVVSKGNTKANSRKLQSTASPGPSSANLASGDGTAALQEEQQVNSDEEVENIMQAIQCSKPRALVRKPYYFVKRRRQCYRLRDILIDAITPKPAPNCQSESSNTLTSLYNMSPTPYGSAGPSPLQQQYNLSHTSFPSSSNVGARLGVQRSSSSSTSSSSGITGNSMGMIGFAMDGSPNMFAAASGSMHDAV